VVFNLLRVWDIYLLFLSFNLLIGWQLSIWNCCKPFFSLLYNCQLLCFWRLALSTAVEVFPGLFSGYCLFEDIYSLCLIICPIYECRLFLKILKVIFILSPFENLRHSLFYLSILFSTFFPNIMFQMHIRPFIYFILGSMFPTHRKKHSKYNFLIVFIYLLGISDCEILSRILITVYKKVAPL
jgi:hypothetical protein